MPPILALIGCAGLVGWLLRREWRLSDNRLGALWIPVIWLFIICSRTTSQWLELLGFNLGAGIVEEEGSPLDAMVYSLLILAGLRVLRQRQVRLQTVMRYNVWLTAFIVYCLISCVWSDYPFVSFKRWVKILGHPVMMMILFTEPDLEVAMMRMVKFCGYVIIPVSVLFIKYFPQWGRGFDEWTGAGVNTGITNNKNTLGSVCLVLGYFFFWHLLQIWKRPRGVERRNELIICGGLLAMNFWLLQQAHSATSSVSLVLAMAMVILLGRSFIDKRRVGLQVIGGGLLIVALLTFSGVNLYTDSLAALGKNATLTDRTAVWAAVLAEKFNPVLGTGFEAFWLGDRRERLWTTFFWQPRQAHNGYLETYLNLGLVGLALMLILIVTTYFKGKRELLRNFEKGRFQLGFLAAFVIYNWTEAAFKALHPVWFVFYLIAMDYRQPAPVLVAEPPVTDPGLNPEYELKSAPGGAG